MDDRPRTTNFRVLGAVYVMSRDRLTYAAYFMARSTVGNMLFFERASASTSTIPTATCTPVEVVHVGPATGAREQRLREQSPRSNDATTELT